MRAGRSASDGDPGAHRAQPRRVDVHHEPAPERPGDAGDVEHAAGGDQGGAARVALAADHGRVGGAVQQRLDLLLEEGALLLDHDDLGEPVGERPHDRRLERPDQRRLEEADAERVEVGEADAEVGERGDDVAVGLARGEDADAGGTATVDDVEAGVAHVVVHGVETGAGRLLLEQHRPRREHPVVEVGRPRLPVALVRAGPCGTGRPTSTVAYPSAMSLWSFSPTHEPLRREIS